jgi:acetyl-CoA acetyltransferase
VVPGAVDHDTPTVVRSRRQLLAQQFKPPVIDLLDLPRGRGQEELQPLSARLQTPVLKEVVRSCGLSERDAEETAEKFRLAFAPWEEDSFPGMPGQGRRRAHANRIDLGGTNMTIDAACSRPLGAVKAAVSDLAERRSDTMVVGGCDTENTIFMYRCFSKTPAFSKQQRIHPFDKMPTEH